MDTNGRRTSTCRVGAIAAAAFGLLISAMVAAIPGAAHPEYEGQQEVGVGVLVNSPPDLAGFREAVHWSGSGPVAHQTAALVYAGTGCTPATYQQVDVDGKIAIIDDHVGATGDVCPNYTLFQKAQAAEQAGAIGLVQVRRDDEVTERNAIASGIPALELKSSDGQPIRNAVVGGHTVNVTLMLATDVPTERLSYVPCVGGRAGPFECAGVDLVGFVPHAEFNSSGISDIWGWTDPEPRADGIHDEYVILGKTNGIAFFRVTDPSNAVYLGELPNPGLIHAIWHDIKVYKNHAFTVSESEKHGMTVFDLTRLRAVHDKQEWGPDAHYRLNSAAHNIAINEASGFAYIVGGNTATAVPDQCLSGLHMVNIKDPKRPKFAGCYFVEGGPGTAARQIGSPAMAHSPAAYVHDAQCVIYNGPDERHTGKEVCFNAAETKIVIVDVTNKKLPKTLGVTDYPNVGYVHQGWLTEDHGFLVVNDELDEMNARSEDSDRPGVNTRTLVIDVRDLEHPKLHFEHIHDTISPDHNNYVHQGLLYQSNYSSGLRVLRASAIDDPENPRLEPLGFFDTFPEHSRVTFDGTWSNYPFFESGTIAVSGREEGLFLLRLQDQLQTAKRSSSSTNSSSTPPNTTATSRSEPVVVPEALSPLPSSTDHGPVVADGGTFPFPGAVFRGSTGIVTLDKPVGALGLP